MKFCESPCNNSKLTLFAPWRQAIGISAATAWRWQKSGFITTVKIGRRVFIFKDEISRFEARAVAGEFCQECAASILAVAPYGHHRSRSESGAPSAADTTSSQTQSGDDRRKSK